MAGVGGVRGAEAHVLGLEVTVDDRVPVVYVLQRERELQHPRHDLRFGHGLIHLAHTLHLPVEVAARAEGHDEA